MKQVWINLFSVCLVLSLDYDDMIQQTISPGRGHVEFLTIDKHTTNSSWKLALDTMDYHRRRMTEYMCKKYLAEDVINSVSNKSISKRTGMQARSMSNHLMDDTGSTKYKDWLAR